jgi:hypothetical protein
MLLMYYSGTSNLLGSMTIIIMMIIIIIIIIIMQKKMAIELVAKQIYSYKNATTEVLATRSSSWLITTIVWLMAGNNAGW